MAVIRESWVTWRTVRNDMCRVETDDSVTYARESSPGSSRSAAELMQ